jgi:Holliday junction resolvasome RuvABC endonuclease subunit
MGVGSLVKAKGNKVIGIDASTKSLAFAVIEDGKPLCCGEVEFRGSDIYEKLNDARLKTQALVDKGILVGDYVCLESAVMVNNRQVVIKLAYFFGAILSVLLQNKMKVVTIPPIEWQTGIGNPNLTKAEKDAIKQEFPGETAKQYGARGREIRKQRTLDIARNYFQVPNDSDNIGDAIGICLYGYETLTRRV